MENAINSLCKNENNIIIFGPSIFQYKDDISYNV